MIHSRHNNLPDARTAAMQASIKYKGKYITLFPFFNLEVEVNARLHPQAPSDSYGTTYWLNGKEKPFSESQINVSDKLGHLHT